MEGSIREATAKDYDELCELFEEVDVLHHDNLPHIFQTPNDSARRYDHYIGIMTDENVRLLVAEIDENLVGFVHIVLRDTPAHPIFKPRNYVVVESIGVSSEYQNQGMGRMLMEAVHVWAAEKGATSIELNVYEFNHKAINFYQRLGYELLSRKMIHTLDE